MIRSSGWLRLHSRRAAAEGHGRFRHYVGLPSVSQPSPASQPAQPSPAPFVSPLLATLFSPQLGWLLPQNLSKMPRPGQQPFVPVIPLWDYRFTIISLCFACKTALLRVWRVPSREKTRFRGSICASEGGRVGQPNRAPFWRHPALGPSVRHSLIM